MSTLSVNNVQDLGADAVVTNGVVNASALPAGSILQVVSTAKTDVFSASVAVASYAAITGLTATITPSSASNKILVFCQIAAGDNSASEGHVVKLTRGGSDILLGDSAGSRQRVSVGVAGAPDAGGGRRQTNASIISFLDSPASTSALTYGVSIGHVSPGTETVYVNRASDDTDTNARVRMTSTITVMEVAG